MTDGPNEEIQHPVAPHHVAGNLPRSRYELVMIAAREARRLNEMARLSGKEIKRRVTEVSWERLQENRIRYTYSDEPLPQPKLPTPVRPEIFIPDDVDDVPSLDEGA